MKKISLITLLYFLPLVAIAAGLVPCGGKDEAMCDTDICFLFKLIDNVSDWFVTISGIVVIFMIIFGGLKMVISVGNVTAKTNSRKLIATAIIGYTMILIAWMAVDTFLKFFTIDSSWGVWNPFSCT